MLNFRRKWRSYIIKWHSRGRNEQVIISFMITVANKRTYWERKKGNDEDMRLLRKVASCVPVYQKPCGTGLSRMPL